jgi:hypothetical protein
MHHPPGTGVIQMLTRSVALLILLAIPARAEVRRLCKVSSGFWSSIVEVEFETGTELNKAAKVYTFSPVNVYALVWFSQSEVAILKLDSPLFITSKASFGPDDFKQCFTYVLVKIPATQVNSDDLRQWGIEAHRTSYGEWIDPRVDEKSDLLNPSLIAP